MRERLGAKDYRFLAVCLVLLGGTVWYSTGNFYRAFPEASIDFKVSREDAQSIAAKFLARQGYRVEGYRQAAQFAYDDEAKTFLEREAGLEQANRIMGTKVRLWQWSYRWFRPLEKEEYSVGVTPRGQLAAFEHELAETAARPAATAEQARALAEDFLRTRMGRDPAALEFLEISDRVRPHRTDRTLTWKERDFTVPNAHQGIAADSSYRIAVGVWGNEVGSYREYLKIPEQWTRDYQRLRSKNETAQMVDTVVTVLLVVGMVIVIVMRVRRHDVPWRRAAMVGMIGMGLGFLAQLNEFPLHEFAYPTTDSYGSFVSRQLLNAILAALGMGGLVFVLTAAAEPLYREALPGQVSLGHLFSLRGLRTKRFFLGAVLGITLTGIFIAYQTAFYIVAYRYGAWSPADVPYSDILNTKFPWAYVLFGGFLPAVSEEFLFRMFAIPFLRKVTRSLVAGLILAGFIWGFGHSGYPQQPFYIRGVEVGIGGVALGIVMLRWGILPTLVWHYSVDAMYSAMLMMRSEHLYYKLSGAAAAGIVVLPVVAALVAYWRGGGFAPVEGLLNRDEAAPAEAPAEPAAIPAGVGAAYQPMLTRKRWIAAAVALAGILTLGIPVHRFGRSPVYKVPAESARRASTEFLKTQSLDPRGFESVTYPDAHWGRSDQFAAKYFLERLPLERASAMFERNRPLQHWATRYFRALDREEVTVSVHPETGRVRAVSHTIPEDRPGADLPPDRAQEIAAQFAASMGTGVGEMDLKESSSDKKKARRDYALEWEARTGDARNVDEARWRVHVGVAGDRAVDFGSYWKTPETFDRERERQSALSIVVTVARLAAVSGLIVYGLWLLIQATRKGEVPWRRAILLALPATLLFPVAGALSLSLMMKNYDTAIPLQTFKAVTYMVLVMSVLFGFLIMTAAAAILTTFYPDAVAALSRAGRRAMGMDAAVALLAAIGLGIAANQIGALLMDRFHAQALLTVGTPDMVGITAPAVAAVAGAARSVVTDAAALGLIGVLVQRVRKRWMVAAGALVALCSMVPGGVRTPGEFALGYASALVAVACAAAFCVWFGRRNWLAYALVLWVLALRGPLMELLGNGNPSLDIEGWIVAAVIAVSVGWVMMPTLPSR